MGPELIINIFSRNGGSDFLWVNKKSTYWRDNTITESITFYKD